MAAGTTVPSTTLKKKEQFLTSHGHSIPVLGFVPGVGVPAVTLHNLGEAAANGGTQLTVAVDSDSIYEFSFFDATSGATLATGVSENIIVRPGISAADAVIATFGETTITDYIHAASVYPILQLKIEPTQTHISFATITGGTKAIRVFARRLE